MDQRRLDGEERLAERDAWPPDTRSPAQCLLGDPPIWRSALALKLASHIPTSRSPGLLPMSRAEMT
jgi:hypothetical protein